MRVAFDGQFILAKRNRKCKIASQNVGPCLDVAFNCDVAAVAVSWAGDAVSDVQASLLAISKTKTNVSVNFRCAFRCEKYSQNAD